MLKWSENLIVGDTLRTRKDSIIKRINDKKPVFSVYLLTLPSGSEGQLDIISAYFLIQDRIREMTPEILGIFGSRKEALREITRLSEECFTKNGNVDLQQYLRELNILQ